MRRFASQMWTKSTVFIGKQKTMNPVIKEEGGTMIRPKSQKEIDEMNKYYKKVIEGRAKGTKVINMKDD